MVELTEIEKKRLEQQKKMAAEILEKVKNARSVAMVIVTHEPGYGDIDTYLRINEGDRVSIVGAMETIKTAVVDMLNRDHTPTPRPPRR